MLLWALLLGVSVFSVSGRGLPEGGVVRYGEVDISSHGSTMTLEQRTSKSIVEWKSFDVGAGYLVEVLQPSAAATMLARVTGGGASEIFGQLRANGGFYLINPNGILFGSGAVVDVNRLLATTRGLTDDDFLTGRLNLTGASTKSVENFGTIQASAVGMVARRVENGGDIHAPQVVLAGGGERICLQNFGNGGSLSIDFSGLGGEESCVVNGGEVLSDGGEAILTASSGMGQVWSEAGKVEAAAAEFSGRNVALGHLGDVAVEHLILDPTAELIIGKESAQAAGYGYEITSEGVGREELELSADVVQPEFSEGVGYGFYDEDGNGWTYLRRESNTIGGVLESYSYTDPVLTYYNSDYLNAQLGLQDITLQYSSHGTTNGVITLEDGVRLAGNHNLTLQAENDLVVGRSVMNDNAGVMQFIAGRDMTIGDLTSSGALELLVGNHLTIGDVQATELTANVKNSLVLTNNVISTAGDIELCAENVRLGGDLEAAGGVSLGAETIVSTADNRLTSVGDLEVKGDWQAEENVIELVSTQGDVDFAGAIWNAETIRVNGEGAVRISGDLAASEEISAVAGGGLEAIGSFQASGADFTGGGDMKIQGKGGSSVETLAVHSEGSGTEVSLVWKEDLPEITVEVSGQGTSVVAEVGDVASGHLIATGEGSSLEVNGQILSLQEIRTVSGDIQVSGAQVRIGKMESEKTGDVCVQSAGDFVVGERLVSGGELKVDVCGRINLEEPEALQARGRMELIAGDFDSGRTALPVNAGGRLYLGAGADVRKTDVFAWLSGKSGDNAIHPLGRGVPGVVIYHGRVWLGRTGQMGKMGRGESELFWRIRSALHQDL